MVTQVERIAMIEVRLKQVEETVSNMDSKIDELLVLRYKGVGAFWLASALVGTGIVGFLTSFMNWFKT